VTYMHPVRYRYSSCVLKAVQRTGRKICSWGSLRNRYNAPPSFCLQVRA